MSDYKQIADAVAADLLENGDSEAIIWHGSGVRAHRGQLDREPHDLDILSISDEQPVLSGQYPIDIELNHVSPLQIRQLSHELRHGFAGIVHLKAFFADLVRGRAARKIDIALLLNQNPLEVLHGEEWWQYQTQRAQGLAK